MLVVSIFISVGAAPDVTEVPYKLTTIRGNGIPMWIFDAFGVV